MQVKQETSITTTHSTHHPFAHSPNSGVSASSGSCGSKVTSSSTHDMQCLPIGSGQTALQDKNSYSLWAEYFDNFPIVTEFDLRSGSAAAGSTGSSIASSSSSSENWSSPGSGSPFSDCEQDDSTFLDDHSVPTSVIDEIVQTLKMDGYNFDHLGDGIIDSTSSYPVKQEQEVPALVCFAQNPVYTCLNAPKQEAHSESNTTKKYNGSLSNGSSQTCSVAAVENNCLANNNMDISNAIDQTMENKWCNNTGTLPSMSEYCIIICLFYEFISKLNKTFKMLLFGLKDCNVPTCKYITMYLHISKLQCTYM